MALLLVPAAAASADSIVFVKNANVWVASPDGSSQRQLTRDGTADHPYRSPSQADDGIVAASYLDGIRLIDRRGKVVRELDPPPLTNSVSHVMDGTPVDVAISPDGSKIAYTLVNASCPVGASCGARAATGYVTSTGQALPGNLYLSNPSWAGNSRTLVFGGYLHQVNTHDLVAAEDVHWFDDMRHRRPARRDRPRRRRAERPGRQARAGARLRQRHAHHVVQRRSARAAEPAVRHRQARRPPRADLGARRSVAGLGRARRVWIKPSALDCTVQPSLVIPGGSEPTLVPPTPRAGTAHPEGERLARARQGLGPVRDGVRHARQARVARQDDRKEAHDARRRGHGQADPEAEALKRGAKVTVRATVTLADGTATTLQRRIRTR